VTAILVIPSGNTSDCYMSYFQARPLTVIYPLDLQPRPLTAQTCKQDLLLLYVSHLPAIILIAVSFISLSNDCGCCICHIFQ